MGDCGGGGGRGVVWVDECKESSYYLHRFYIVVTLVGWLSVVG